jgi:hypothetical protein
VTSRETSTTSGTPRNVHAQSPVKRAMTAAVATFLLAAAFALTGAPAATAAPGCGNPGVCPDFPGMEQLNEQPTAYQLPGSSW